jgi:hypothetical protein
MCINLLMQIVFAGQTVAPAEGCGVNAASKGCEAQALARHAGRLAVPKCESGQPHANFRFSLQVARGRDGRRIAVPARGGCSVNFCPRRAITPAPAACALQPRPDAYGTIVCFQGGGLGVTPVRMRIASGSISPRRRKSPTKRICVPPGRPRCRLAVPRCQMNG